MLTDGQKIGIYLHSKGLKANDLADVLKCSKQLARHYLNANRLSQKVKERIKTEAALDLDSPQWLKVEKILSTF